MFIFYLLVSIILIILFFSESFLLRFSLNKIPVRILVNGTRGKSTTVRILYEILKNSGYKTFANPTEFEFNSGITAIVGPNGSGKSNITDAIRWVLGEQSFSTLRAKRTEDMIFAGGKQRARLGMARSFQITSLFPGFTVQQNMELAVQATRGSSYRFWKRADTDTRLHNPAQKALARIGLTDRAPATAANLSHGEQRLLEIGMALATDSELLLIDEPMAGLGPGSARNLAELIRGLKGGVTILLVEHDMQAVFSLADRITVLVEGRVAASGPPEQIRNNPAVQEAYLGAPC